jgi:hypothetical protein
MKLMLYIETGNGLDQYVSAKITYEVDMFKFHD